MDFRFRQAAFRQSPCGTVRVVDPDDTDESTDPGPPGDQGVGLPFGVGQDSLVAGGAALAALVLLLVVVG